MTIKDLKLMNEADMILWFANAKAKDLGIVLKNEGIKGISKMKKAEKLSMIVNLVVEDNITDDAIDKVVEDTKRLNDEINARQSFKEEFEQTLCARWQAKEINWEEFKQTIINHNISIPINVADKEDTKNMLKSDIDLFSEYEHFIDSNNKYYSVLNKNFNWSNVFRNNGRYRWKNWEDKQFYEKNTINKDCVHQLAFDYDENGEYNILVYKNFELLGNYIDGNIENIKKLIEYDNRLSYEDLEVYAELLERLNKQRKEYNKIIEADKMLRKKFNFIKCRYKKFSSFANENPKRRY